MNKKITVIVSIIILIGCVYAVDMYRINNNKPVIFSNWGHTYTPQEENTTDNTENLSSLYNSASEFLEQEFHRVYDKYYDIQELIISNWDENGNEATFFYKMTYLHYNRNPDSVEYIQKAKEAGQEQYETLYNDYLSLKDANYEFKVVLNGDNLELYSNVSPKGTEWAAIKIDDYILSN